MTEIATLRAALRTAGLALLLAASGAAAQTIPPLPPDTVAPVAVPVQDSAGAVRPDSAAVVVRGDTLTWLYGSERSFRVSDRASMLSSRLDSLRREGVDSSAVRVVRSPDGPEIWVGDYLLAVVTPADTLARGSASEASAAVAEAARVGLQGALFARNVRDILLGLLETILVTVALYWLMRLMARWYPRLYHRIRETQADKLPVIRFQGLVLLSGERIEQLVLSVARVSRLLISAVLLFVYFPLVFSFFPPTRVLAQRIFALALEPTRLAFYGVIGYLPNLFYIAVIVVLTRYGFKLIRMVFTALDQGAIRIPGFFPDWAYPTYKIVRALGLAFAVILIWPYLPNSGSDAFRGVAAFLGLLVTFGSAGAVSNVVGGVVMIYMRPFQIGDRVRIADTVGDIIERGMLVTRIRTPKNVEITVPNSMVLGSHIVNYSAAARDRGVILHTTLTIGYDSPWPKVHEVMKEAARRTDGIMETPEPFVLQTALGDYAISYELNAYTSEPNRMPALYSGLHQHLQETFAEAGIEILSPIYHALRDGNPSTLPTLPSEDGEGPAAKARPGPKASTGVKLPGVDV